MRIVSYRRVARHVYEITTESEKYGRVTQNVLVLPEWAIRGESCGADLPDELTP
jgi:hypothetical protein